MNIYYKISNIYNIMFIDIYSPMLKFNENVNVYNQEMNILTINKVHLSQMGKLYIHIY